MTTVTVDSTKVGTKLATGADVKITGLTLAQPTSFNDDRTQLCLVDAAAAPTPTSLPPRTLYAVDLTTLAAMNWYTPGITMAPGITGPTGKWPADLKGVGSFSNGVFVKSCPAGTSFTLTTGP